MVVVSLLSSKLMAGELGHGARQTRKTAMMRYAIPIVALVVVVGIGIAERWDTSTAGGPIAINGAAGRDLHDSTALIVQDQYLVLYTLKNTSSKPFVFSEIEEVFSPAGQSEGLTQSVLPTTGVDWRLMPGAALTFLSGTDGYTRQLEKDSAGGSIIFSVTVKQKGQSSGQHFSAQLPPLATLPQASIDLLSLQTSPPPPAIDLSKIPKPVLSPLHFSRK